MKAKLRLGIATDHGGFRLKQELTSQLRDAGLAGRGKRHEYHLASR
jgi:hypothetical protein